MLSPRSFCRRCRVWRFQSLQTFTPHTFKTDHRCNCAPKSIESLNSFAILPCWAFLKLVRAVMKFNLRDLLWLTLSIALLICLITTYRQLDSKTEELSIAKRSVGKLVKRHSWRFNRNSKKSFQSEPSPFSSGTPVAKTTVQKNEPEELGFVQQVECIEQELLRTEGKEKSHQQSIAVLASRNQQLKNAVLIAKQSKMESSNVQSFGCLLYTSPSPRDLSTSRMPSSA